MGPCRDLGFHAPQTQARSTRRRSGGHHGTLGWMSAQGVRHNQILIGLVIGAVAGGVLKALSVPDSPQRTWFVENVTNPIGQLFLRLLLMIVLPLVFSALVIGVAGIGEARKLGRIAFKSFAYTLVLSAISVLIGLSLANLVRPGTRIDPEVRDQLVARYAVEAQEVTESVQSLESGKAPLLTLIETLIPVNPLSSMARQTPDMLGVMFFALIFGFGLTLIGESTAAPVVTFFTSVFEAASQIVGLIMRMAPLAVGCLLFTLTARFGFGFLISLGWFVGTVLAGLALHMFGVYSLSVKFLSRIPPMEFFRRTRLIMVTAFSTSSSNATLPTALSVSEKELGVPRNINSFVLTVGATANQNGTALYEGVTCLFLAQLVGVDLSLGQQLLVLYMAILGGVGTAGVPSGSIPFVMVILSTLGINPELIAIIIGIDRILDMCRTTLNVLGDVTAATYVARSEGAELLPAAPRR